MSTPEQETIEQTINRVRVASGVVGLSVTGLVERLRSDPVFIESLPTVIELRLKDKLNCEAANESATIEIRLHNEVKALKSQLAEAQAQLGASEPVGYLLTWYDGVKEPMLIEHYKPTDKWASHTKEPIYTQPAAKASSVDAAGKKP